MFGQKKNFRPKKKKKKKFGQKKMFGQKKNVWPKKKNSAKKKKKKMISALGLKNLSNIIHGSWHGPAWGQGEKLLNSAGFSSEPAILLRGTGNS